MRHHLALHKGLAGGQVTFPETRYPEAEVIAQQEAVEVPPLSDTGDAVFEVKVREEKAFFPPFSCSNRYFKQGMVHRLSQVSQQFSWPRHSQVQCR